jgi:hypothetical protein
MRDMKIEEKKAYQLCNCPLCENEFKIYTNRAISSFYYCSKESSFVLQMCETCGNKITVFINENLIKKKGGKNE